MCVCAVCAFQNVWSITGDINAVIEGANVSLFYRSIVIRWLVRTQSHTRKQSRMHAQGKYCLTEAVVFV